MDRTPPPCTPLRDDVHSILQAATDNVNASGVVAMSTGECYALVSEELYRVVGALFPVPMQRDRESDVVALVHAASVPAKSDAWFMELTTAHDKPDLFYQFLDIECTQLCGWNWRVTATYPFQWRKIGTRVGFGCDSCTALATRQLRGARRFLCEAHFAETAIAGAK
jgi:hypothetical protein